MFSDLLPETPVITGRTSCDQFFGTMNVAQAIDFAANAAAADGVAFPTAASTTVGLATASTVRFGGIGIHNNPATDDIVTTGVVNTGKTRTFCMPIYSGIMGVLMPDKKFLPLSLMPLEIEFTINPHALYCAGGTGLSRQYTVTRMEIYAHMFFFEQEVHRAIEASVAQAGLYLHFNSFRLGPIGTLTGGADSNINQYAQINVHDKSINSIHTVFMYSDY